MFEFGKITSKISGNVTSVTYAWVGKGRKTVHLSPLNDETLCGRAISEYTDAENGSEAVLCSRCWKSFAAREVATSEPIETTCGTRFVKVGSDEPGTCEAPCVPGESECAFHLGDAQAMAEFLSGDSLAIVNNTLVTVRGESDIPVLTSMGDGPIGEFDYDAYQEELHNDPEVQRMYALEASTQEAETAVVGVQQNVPGLSGEPTHWHAADCRDVKREMNRWGQSKRDTFSLDVSTIAEILTFEMGDVSSDTTVSGTDEWWDEIVYNCDGLVKIMPCLILPGGMANEREVISHGDWFTLNAEGAFRITSECMSCGLKDVPMDHLHFKAIWTLLEAGVSVESAIVSATAPNGELYANMRKLSPWYHHTQTQTGPESVQSLMDMINRDPESFALYEMPNQDIVVAWRYANSDEIGSVFYVTLPQEDAGFIETMVTQEYRLSVTVDGAQIDLGWHEFTVNAAQANDVDVIAALYGERHGSGKPRHGWGSIISVTDVMGD